IDTLGGDSMRVAGPVRMATTVRGPAVRVPRVMSMIVFMVMLVRPGMVAVFHWSNLTSVARPYVSCSNVCIRQSDGNNTRAHNTVTSSVAAPPRTIAGTRPNHAAVTPDSNSPSSFDAPMNTAFTALTRPRISSGVFNCTSNERMNTLIMSPTPSTTRAVIATQNVWVKPNTTVAPPNAATPTNMVAPTCRETGR